MKVVFLFCSVFFVVVLADDYFQEEHRIRVLDKRETVKVPVNPKSVSANNEQDNEDDEEGEGENVEGNNSEHTNALNILDSLLRKYDRRATPTNHKGIKSLLLNFFAFIV